MLDLVATTLQLVSIPSVTGNEAAICDHVAAWLPADLEVTRVSNSLIVQSPNPHPERPCIGLFGHLDTVLPSADQACEVRDERLYGCGASDMKGGVALMMAALTERHRWSCNLACVFYEREEGPQVENGLVLLMDKLPPMDLAVMLEPTANQVQLGCVGVVNAKVTFQGKRAHSARPWQGDNAIYKATRFLERLRDWGKREVMVDGLPFYEVMNATMANTSNSHNVIPDAFEVHVNYRFAPGRTVAEAAAEVESLVAGEAAVRISDTAVSGAVCASHALVSEWTRRCGLVVEPKQAWTDVARMTAAGVPAINFGPGDPAQAHQAGEWVAVAALHDGYRLLGALLE